MTNTLGKFDPELEAIAAKIIHERDDLLEMRAKLMSQRRDLLVQLRHADRRLADCRAAARFFDLKIDFPDDESDQIERIDTDRAIRERAIRIAEHNVAYRRAEQLARSAMPERVQASAVMPRPKSSTLAATAEGAAAQVLTNAPADTKSGAQRTVREIILERLAAVGPKGTKANVLREYYERTFGRTIHEKTIGMTLYRLQNEGIVRREGHTWFLAPPIAETKNPGGETPGLFETNEPNGGHDEVPS